MIKIIMKSLMKDFHADQLTGQMTNQPFSLSRSDDNVNHFHPSLSLSHQARSAYNQVEFCWDTLGLGKRTNYNMHTR